MTKEDYVMFAVFNILFFQGIPLPWQTKRTVFRDRPFPITVVNKSTRRVPLYINLIGINVIIIIIYRTKVNGVGVVPELGARVHWSCDELRAGALSVPWGTTQSFGKNNTMRRLLFP